jgi:hypothetical protein
MDDLEMRFWDKVRIGDGCWEWTAHAHISGYGIFRVGRKLEKASRFSWSLANGPIPRGMLVLHRCDNPSCVRPGHLFLGTHQDNADDKMAKGRHVVVRGEKHHEAKLSSNDVLEIRRRHGLGETQTKLGREFGVTQAMVSEIVLRKSWRHLP